MEYLLAVKPQTRWDFRTNRNLSVRLVINHSMHFWLFRQRTLTWQTLVLLCLGSL